MAQTRCAFTLAIMAAQGRDVKLDPARIAGYRNFGTKLLERHAFCRDERREGGSGFLRRDDVACDQPLDPDGTCAHRTRSDGSDRKLYVSMTRPAATTASSGTSSATGIWNC